MACCKMLHILWPSQTASRLLEFVFHPSLPWMESRRKRSKQRQEKSSLEKPQNVVLPQLSQLWISLPEGETLKPAKLLSELCSAYRLYCAFCHN